jgi:hypothetical protein
MSDTPASAAFADDLFSGRAAVAGKPVTWSPKAKRLGGIGGALIGALYLFIAAEIAMAVMNGYDLWIFNRIENGEELSDGEYEIYNMVSGLGGVVAGGSLFLVNLATIFLFCRFVYRAMRNLDLSKAAGELMPPAWAVIYNFIPILNLWKPHQAMRQIWRSSQDPTRASRDPPFIFWLWWLPWLVSNWISNASFRLALQAGVFAEEITDFELYKTTLWLDIASAIFMIPAILFLLPILRQIMQAQDAMKSASAFDD